jgi:hypothetical protein
MTVFSVDTQNQIPQKSYVIFEMRNVNRTNLSILCT